MSEPLFLNRHDAALQLADKLRHLHLHRPLVLGIARGGMEIAAVLAHELRGDLDVVLACKLRHPLQPESAIGAASEHGDVFLDDRYIDSHLVGEHLEAERTRRLAQIESQRKCYRRIRPAASIYGRNVVLTDDGMDTGASMYAALQVVRSAEPAKTVVAVPVAPRGRWSEIQEHCDVAATIAQLEIPTAIEQHYTEFVEIDDDRVCAYLHQAVSASLSHRAHDEDSTP